jgi:LytS/YehU family sensor histidine kinase
LKNESKEDKPGIGLENIKKRLNLLYKNNHQLRIENKENWYVVNLIISNLNRIKDV